MAGMGEGVCAAEYRQVRQGHSLWTALDGTLFSLWPRAAVEATSCEPQAGEEGIAPPFLLSSADFLQD